MFFALHLLFAIIFMYFAWRALPRGMQFLKHGWLLVQANASQPGYRDDGERRRAISSGGYFLVGGLLWLSGGIVGAALGILFAIQALLFIGVSI